MSLYGLSAPRRQTNGHLTTSAHMPLVLLAVMAIGSAPASHALPKLADPFATETLARPSPGARQQSGHEPCAPELAVGQAARPLTLAEVLATALCRHPSTHLAWANARAQAAQVGIAQAAYLPTVTINTSASRSMNSSSNSLQITSISAGSGQPINRLTPIISLNYLLYNFGAREAQLENARHLLDAANWTHDATTQTVMFTALAAYYQVFAAQAAAVAAQVSEQASAAASAAAKKRHEVGAVALSDVLQAQTAFAQAKLARQKAEGDAKIAIGTLANALGLEADTPLAITAPALPKPDAEQEAQVRRLIDQAKTLRPDLQAAEAAIAAAESSVAAAEAGHWPSVSLIGNFGYNFTSLPSETQSWTLGVQLSVPLFTGFNVTYQIRSAKAQLAAKRANFEQLEQTVGLEVWKTYQSLIVARDSFTSSEELLASATQSERVALGRYQAGAGNLIELLNAQASLANARQQSIQTQYTWLTQKAQLAKALGQLDFSSLPQ